MLAYLTWHRPAEGVDAAAYEHALERFHRSLAHRPPSGFRGSAAFRLADVPWLVTDSVEHDGEAGYEDWYLLDDWSAVGVLEEAAVAAGHTTAHAGIAALAGGETAAIYRFVEGNAQPGPAQVAVWVSSAPGPLRPSLSALLGDGMDPASDGLWRRCLALGPAPEYCLLARETPPGVSAERLPSGWSARAIARHALWDV
jgi:hypothetical protein